MNDTRQPVGSAPGTVTTSRGLFKLAEVPCAILAYGSLATFLFLIAAQTLRWIRQGEWTHVGISDAMRDVLNRAGVIDADPGRLATLLHWLEAPADWLGLHKVMEVLPASLALFLASMIGNALLIYCRERREAANGH